MNKYLLAFIPKCFTVIILLLFWELFSRYGVPSQQLFPPPSRIMDTALVVIKNHELFIDTIYSFFRILIGFFIGAIIGIFVGILTGRNNKANQLITPLIQIFRPIPPIALVPFAIIWFGIGEPSKWVVIIWGVFFPVWLNTHIGVLNVDDKYLWAAKSLGADKKTLLFEIIVPHALKYILAGLRVSIAIAFICVVVAEMAGASNGLGFRISVSHLAFRVDKMMVSLITLGIIGALTDYFFTFIINKILPWLSFNSD